MVDITLPKEAENIITVLNSNGYKAYAVGGCVRDFVMGNLPCDYDITTDALPQDIKRIFESAKVIDIGIKHGTVTVIQNGFTAEITTFRTDGTYRDFRHPEGVEFCTELKDDLKRRDFTVNALAFNPKEGLKDYFGGVDDIKNKIIRCVGEPNLRFKEDALRILRALRFSSVLGFDIEDKTKKAIFNTYPLLKKISAERIFEELKKLLCGKNVYKVLVDYKDIICSVVEPLAQDTHYEQMCFLVDKAPFDLRLHALFGFCTPEWAKSGLKSLRADNKTIKSVCNTLNALPQSCIITEVELLKLLGEYGKDAVCSAVKLKEILCLINEQDYKDVLCTQNILNEIISSNKCYRIADLEIDGCDLMALGIPKGKPIGELMCFLLQEVIEGRLLNTKDTLKKRAKEYILKR